MLLVSLSYLNGVVVGMPCWVKSGSVVPSGNNASFGGLGVAGLITVIVVSVLLIVTTVWLINGTKKRD